MVGKAKEGEKERRLQTIPKRQTKINERIKFTEEFIYDDDNSTTIAVPTL